jgi:hypothetical protein
MHAETVGILRKLRGQRPGAWPFTRRLLWLLSCADDHWPTEYGQHQPVRHPGNRQREDHCGCLPSRAPPPPRRQARVERARLDHAECMSIVALYWASAQVIAIGLPVLRTAEARPRPPPASLSTEAGGVEPVGSVGVGVAAGVVQAVGEVVQGPHVGVAEAYVVAPGEVAGEFLAAEYGDDGPGWVGDEGHAGFDEDVGPCLEPPCGLAVGGCGGCGDVFVGGEVGDDGLDVLKCLVEDLADVGAGVAAGVDELAPFLWLEADGAEPVEQGGWRGCRARR